jgi:hypothetical protein
MFICGHIKYSSIFTPSFQGKANIAKFYTSIKLLFHNVLTYDGDSVIEYWLKISWKFNLKFKSKLKFIEEFWIFSWALLENPQWSKYLMKVI